MCLQTLNIRDVRPEENDHTQMSLTFSLCNESVLESRKLFGTFWNIKVDSFCIRSVLARNFALT